MKSISSILKALLFTILLTNIPVHSIIIFWSDFVPSAHDVFSTFLIAAVPATAACLVKYFCCTRPARRRMRNLTAQFAPHALLRRITRTIIQKINKEDPANQGDPENSVFIDLDDPPPTPPTPCTDRFIIGTGAIYGNFMATLSDDNIARLQRCKGVIFICGDFAQIPGRANIDACSISRENLRAAIQKLITHQIPFLIIHIQEHTNRSSRDGMIGAPSFTVSNLFLPHASHNSIDPLPRIVGHDALSPTTVMNRMRNHVKRVSAIFAAHTGKKYPEFRRAKVYTNIFLRNLDGNGLHPIEESEEDGDSS